MQTRQKLETSCHSLKKYNYSQTVQTFRHHLLVVSQPWRNEGELLSGNKSYAANLAFFEISRIDFRNLAKLDRKVSQRMKL